MAELRADEIARREFSVGFRGFDQHEVRAYLRTVADHLTAMEERAVALEARIVELESTPPQDLDEETLERALGQAATRIIHAAREAAADIASRADAEAARVVNDARRVESATRESAEQRARSVLEDARAQAESLVADASAERARVLDELDARRKELTGELDRLHTVRERLVESYRGVRAVLDDAVRTTVRADRAARAVVEPEPVHAPEPEPESAPAPEPVVIVDASLAPDDVEAPEATAAAPPVAVVRPVEPEERKSSALRLLRRPSDDEQVAAADDIESVRIIRAEPEPDAVVAPEPAPDADAAVEVAVEIAADTEADAEPVPAEPEPVDDLFARLRADRADKVARAEEVLAAPPSDVADDTAPEASGDTPPDAALLAARDDAVADLERALVRAMKRAIADEQNEVLDALRRLRGAPSVDLLLPDASAHGARYEAVLSEAAAGSAAAGALATGGTAGVAGSVPGDLGQAIATDLRLRVDRAVEVAGGDVETLTEAVSAAYREWKTARAEPFARDVVTAAFAAGVFSAASGELRWVVDPAEGGCPDCDDNVLAGPTAKGSLFPTGQPHPPAHAGCRCVAVPAT